MDRRLNQAQANQTFQARCQQNKVIPFLLRLFAALAFIANLTYHCAVQADQDPQAFIQGLKMIRDIDYIPPEKRVYQIHINHEAARQRNVPIQRNEPQNSPYCFRNYYGQLLCY